MRALIFALLLFIAVLLQSTVLQYIQVAGVKPDFVLILIVFYSLINGSREGALWGIFGGLMQDLFTGSYFGLNALCLGGVGYLVGLGCNRLLRESSMVLSGVVFLATIVTEFFRYLLFLSLDIMVLPGELVWGLMFPLGVYHAAITLIFYRPFYRSATQGLMRIPQS